MSLNPSPSHDAIFRQTSRNRCMIREPQYDHSTVSVGVVFLDALWRPACLLLTADSGCAILDRDGGFKGAGLAGEGGGKKRMD